ncbi:MAG: OadG family protein [Oscillospiraceae bacterium]|nr:OadG family protein [Oscillospiraceae bacterium]
MNMLMKVAASGTKMAFGDAAVAAVLGYAMVFFGLVLLMVVIIVVGKIMVARSKATKAKAAAAPTAAQPAAPASGAPAPGSAGQIKLYDTPERDAAMVMAIVANKLGKPLNELRFKSIREVKE